MPGNFASAQDLVSVDEIREDVVLLKDGSLRQVVMVGGVNFALKSDTEQNLITSAYQNFLNGIDFPLQIVVHSRKVNIEKYLDGLARYSAEEVSPLLQNQAEEYREFIRGFVQKNAIMEKTFLESKKSQKIQKASGGQGPRNGRGELLGKPPTAQTAREPSG